jgi:dethiobiotin synthetase
MKSLFVTGTDTDAGKTWISCLLIRQLTAPAVRVAAYKPACSGADTVDNTLRWNDIDALADTLGSDTDPAHICPQRFTAALAPNVAARQENRQIDEQLLLNGFRHWQTTADYLVVEGVGGLLCPLSDQTTVADLASAMKIPLLIVAANRLGVINHTALTIDAAEKRHLPIAAVVINETTASQSEDTTVLRNLNVQELHRICGHYPLFRCGHKSTQLEPVNPPATQLPSLTHLFK